MSAFNTKAYYGSFAKFFHWTIALLIIGLLCVGLLMGGIADETLRYKIYNIHKLTGLTVLLLVILRSLWALINIKPELPAHMSKLERLAEKIGHYALYLLMFAMPLSGWIMSSAAGYYPTLCHFEFVMPFIHKSKPIASFANQAHEVMAYVLIVIVLGHIIAALRHHCVNKDNVLKRMMPGNHNF